MERNSHSTFEELEIYQIAAEFRRAMYQVAKRLPNFENFALANQIRRAGISLTNNIAEGHGRFYYLEQIKFMLQSRGSLQELIDDLNICEDEHYLPTEEITLLKEKGWRVRKLIDGYIRYLRAQKAASVREDSGTYPNRDADDLTNLDLTNPDLTNLDLTNLDLTNPE